MTLTLKLRTALSILCAAMALALLAMPAQNAVASISPGPGTGDKIALKPDITITQVTRAVNRLTGQYIKDRIWFQVTNVGSAYAPGFEISAEWGYGYSNQMWFYFIQQGLAPGEFIWLSLDASGYDLWAGNFQIWADNTQSVTESDETNNVYTHIGP